MILRWVTSCAGACVEASEPERASGTDWARSAIFSTSTSLTTSFSTTTAAAGAAGAGTSGPGNPGGPAGPGAPGLPGRPRAPRGPAGAAVAAGAGAAGISYPKLPSCLTPFRILFRASAGGGNSAKQQRSQGNRHKDRNTRFHVETPISLRWRQYVSATGSNPTSIVTHSAKFVSHICNTEFNRRQ